LASLAEEHVPLGLLIEGRISPPFWKEEALGFRLLHHLPANAPRQSLDYKAAKQCMFFLIWQVFNEGFMIVFLC